MKDRVLKPFPFWRKVIWIALSNIITVASFVVIYIRVPDMKDLAFYVACTCLFMASVSIDLTRMNKELLKYVDEIKQDLAKTLGVKYE